MQRNKEVVVVGGGFAGVMAANRLTQRDDVSVTLINPRSQFVPRMRLHQYVGGTHEATVDFRDVLADRVGLVVGSVSRIDVADRAVKLADGSTIDYDYLVYAVGSGTAESPVPGRAEHAYPMATMEAARRLRAVLADTPKSAPVVVVGGGPVGLETATELAEQGRSVTLVSAAVVAPYLHERARAAARKVFARLGVEVVDETTVRAVRDGSVELDDGRSLPSAVTVWAAGFGVPQLAADSGLSTDDEGRLITDETLTSVDDDRIVAAGDSSAPSDLPYRMSGYIANCLGAHAADTLLARFAGREPETINFAFSAICLSFGRGYGLFQLGHKDTSPTGFYFAGALGRKFKELTLTAGVKQLATEARKPGSHWWPGNRKYRSKMVRERQDSAALV